MPKRTYKLLRFDGGINNDADPRDIADNQFADLQNVAVDEVGKITILGNIQSQRKAIAGSIAGSGRGLFACATDHMGLLDGNIETDARGPGQVYYLVQDGSGIIGKGADGEPGDINCTANQITMYYVDGALRIAEADIASSADNPQWRGYITAKTYGPDSTDADADIAVQWATQSAEIAGAFPTFEPSGGDFQNITFCRNAFVVNEQDDTTGSYTAHSFNNGNATLAAMTDGQADKAASGLRWGVALEFDENSSGTGTWMPTTSTRYKFYITTMYDDHNQESLPQLMQSWPSNLLHGVDSYDNTALQSEMLFTDGDAHETTGEQCAVWFAPAIKVNYNTGQLYNFGATDIDADGSTAASDIGNPRISGVRIYWSSNEDGYSSLWQMFDAKFDEGIKAIGVDGGGGGTSGYAPMKVSGNNFTMDLPVANKWSNPPRYIQYSAVNGHSHTDTIKVDAYKTAVVANRRVYIGNVKQNGIVYGDRMLKSPVNQFDKFPSVNNIDVAIHDGDEIVALVEYADRILQFKKNTCYIINVSGNTEYLETEHKFKGITNPGAACRTDYGVAWVNQNGCYLYNGQQVTDLLEDGGMRKINQSTWSSFISDENYHRIGFNPFKRQLIVLNGTNNSTVLDDAYVYDMVTKSWVYSNAMVADGDTGSNFINDPLNGDLLIFDHGGGTIDKWTNAPTVVTTPVINITTKDIDFGEPAVRKKVYKAYVSYTSGSTCGLVARFGIDGDTTPTIAASSGGTFATNQPEWTVQEIVFGSDANSCKSIQLKLSGTVDNDFAINDISFVYRTKGIK